MDGDVTFFDLFLYFDIDEWLCPLVIDGEQLFDGEGILVDGKDQSGTVGFGATFGFLGGG